MSSGPWEKNDEPGIFGGHSNDLWTSGQDVPGAGPMDGDMGWNELEKEYYEDFNRQIAAQVDQQHRYEDQSSGRKKTKKSARRTHKHVQEEMYHDQGTEVNGKPYSEEIMKVTDVRRGGQKRLKNPFANGSANSFSGGTKIAPYSKSVDCPESGCEVCFSDCLRCENYQVWDAKDDGFRRCYHEYIDLDSRGYYDGTWDDHPENFDPETFERIQEQKQRNEDFEREMELEREDEEFERRAEEMERKADSEYEEYLKDKYGEYEDEGDHEDEEREKDEDENEDDYDEEEENDKDEDDVEDDYGDKDYDDEDDDYDYGEGWRD